MSTGVHLVRRFVGSLRPGGPPSAEEQWARLQLLPGERALWDRMSGADRRHAAGVARSVEAALDGGAERAVLAAALLHDVGKLDSGLGVWGRVGATVAGLAGARARAAEWEERSGPVGRVGRYLRHPERGAALLREAGSDGLTVAWARCHHLPPERWDPAVPPAVGAALKSCDDD
ncbi:MAG TPA: HD domain-containing protein [Acidimicrobiales bacterium]|nr:HD domain-containing protein [Acidimicrobiales bacterium]